MNLTFTNSINWSTKFSCSITGSCTTFSAESLLSADKTKIYTFFINGNLAYFASLLVSTGSVSGSAYKSSISCTSINGLMLQKDNVIATLSCTLSPSSYVLILFNTISNSFIIKASSSLSLYQLTEENAGGRIIIAGQKNSGGYLTKFMIESLNAHPDFTSTTLTMTTITDAISSTSSYSLSSQTTQSISIATYTSMTIAYALTSSYTSDVLYNIAPQIFQISKSTTFQIKPNLPCSISGSTSIIYSIADASSVRRALAPSWVSIDSSTGQVTVNTPSVSSTTDYSFSIASTITGVTSAVSQTINISVFVCGVQNCQTCSTTSSTVCSVCNSGYTLSSGTCTKTTSGTSSSSSSSSSSTTETVTPAINADPQLQSTAVAAQTTTVTTVAVSAGAVGASNAASSTSSPAGFWCMVNQLQLFFLLLLTKAFLPDSVKSVIGGANSAMVNPFEYIPFLDSKKYGEVFEKFNFELNNSALKPFKIKSVSTFYNSFSIMLGIFYIILFHVVIFLIRRFVLVCGIEGKCGKVIKLLKTIVNKVFDILTFGFYVRLLLEINQFFLVSGMNEVFFLDVSEDLRIVSFTFAVLVLLACFIFIVLVTYFSLAMDTSSESGHNKFSEFFSGLRLNKRNRLFISILITRRSLLVVLLFALSSIPSRALIGVLVAFDVPYVIYLVILRPYNETKYNIIEIMNEFIFLLLLSALLVFNTESDWTKTSAYIYMQILSFNCVFSMIVIIIFLIISIVVWIKNRKRNNQTKVEPFKENKEDQHPTMEAMAEPQSMERMTKFKDTKRVNEINEETKQEEDMDVIGRRLHIHNFELTDRNRPISN